MTPDSLAEGQTRIDQYDALHWVWIMLRRTSKKKARDQVQEMLSKLSHGENVDFQAYIQNIREAEDNE